MESLNLLIHQIVIMFLYMAIGFVLYCAGKITKKGSGDIASLLVWLVIPVVLRKQVFPIPGREW